MDADQFRQRIILPLTDSGYIDTSQLPADATFDQVMESIGIEIKYLQMSIDEKNKELSELRQQLYRWEHEERTIWLLFKKRNNEH